VQALNRSPGELRLEDIDVGTLERWRDAFAVERSPTNRTLQKYTIALGSVFKRAMRVYGLPSNPAALMERPRLRRTKEIVVLTAPEVRALVAAAESMQDGAVYLAAAFTGLRMGELLALRWRHIDPVQESLHVRASFARDVESTPKSGSARTVPMVADVSKTLTALRGRGHHDNNHELVFCGPAGGHLDPNGVRKRFEVALEKAELPPMRFHELRHTFGTLAIQRASILQVQNWLGHADIKTTQVYLRYRSQAEDAALLSEVFAVSAGASARYRASPAGSQ